MSSRATPGRPDLDDATRMAKAMAHPLRAKILTHLNDHGTASPADLSRVLDEPIGNVSYHVRMLLDLDCVELVDTRQRRGAIEHFYRATRRALVDDESWAQLPPTVRQGFAVQWFRDAFKDVSSAIDAGTLEQRDDLHLSFSPLELDEESWAELNDRLAEVLRYALELQERSASGGGERRQGRLVMAHYEAP